MEILEQQRIEQKSVQRLMELTDELPDNDLKRDMQMELRNLLHSKATTAIAAGLGIGATNSIETLIRKA